MLRITAKQQLMREIVDILSVLTSEAKLVWGEKGLSVSVVDGSHVALLSDASETLNRWWPWSWIDRLSFLSWGR